ncbi:MAG TPA: protein kinase [Polyangiaceae bacterium]|nr:protein kinase [Polyangiaceae bacterium]
MGSGESGRPGGLEEVPFGNYVLERRIAVGGMSEVFLARPRAGDEPAKEVVIKRLLPDLVEDDSVRKTFELEARLHARIHHGNIVGYYEYGSYAGEPYIALEYVAGVDLFRLMRRAKNEERPLAPGMCVFVAREICAALEAVHAARDERGAPLGVVHRDVTPSNVLVSLKGDVKLGDFGIAKVARGSIPQSSVALKGKYAYLAPEQVSGEPADRRADLFSVAVVLAEMLLGEPLFAGEGQLAVLLAIRDARIDLLRARKDKLPSGLFELLEKALAKAPDARFQTATELSQALRPFERPSRGAARAELSGWASYTLDTVSAARRLEGAVLEVRALTGLPLVHPTTDPQPASQPMSHANPTSQAMPPSQRKTMPEEVIGCLLRSKGGEPRALALPKLIEQLATGHVAPDDEIDLGDGFHRIENVAMLARYLPPSTATTKRLDGPGVPDFTGRLPDAGALEALAWIVRGEETGVLFADQRGEARPRTELYFSSGSLVLASSSEPSTLLGAQLVARGLIDKAELDLAVLVMHKYNGQLGDTLIALGLADPIDVFQAIRSQGRERVMQLFRWSSGELTFYRGVTPAKVDFRLDLDVPALILQGLAESKSDLEVELDWAPRLTESFAATSPAPQWVRAVNWPGLLVGVLRALGAPTKVSVFLEELKKSRGPESLATRHEALRALDACIALGVVERVDPPSEQ